MGKNQLGNRREEIGVVVGRLAQLECAEGRDDALKVESAERGDGIERTLEGFKR